MSYKYATKFCSKTHSSPEMTFWCCEHWHKAWAVFHGAVDNRKYHGDCKVWFAIHGNLWYTFGISDCTNPWDSHIRVCVHNNAPLLTPTSMCHMHTQAHNDIDAHLTFWGSIRLERWGWGGVWGGTGDISCSHNVIHYGRGTLERVQRVLLVCATTHLSLCPPLFLSHSLSLSLSVGEMATAFFLSPRGLRDIPACFPLIRQTYSTYLSLSPLHSLL